MLPIFSKSLWPFTILEKKVDFQEVILKKSKSCSRLGLKLCYGTANENDTDIFIGEVIFSISSYLCIQYMEY